MILNLRKQILEWRYAGDGLAAASGCYDIWLWNLKASMGLSPNEHATCEAAGFLANKRSYVKHNNAIGYK